ncbi:MAG TPA: hypothetical protein VE999_20925 [Gemmataceae bacterium]|nr:hypothetical protein [Gemmataceae bacterium]
MPAAAQAEFQRRVIRGLHALGRGPFKGDIALELRLATTRRSAPQAHTIAKNLLDLLWRPAKELGEPAPALLYVDDRQIHALSVSCVHGEETPNITIGARSMSAFLHDLALASTAERELETDDPAFQYERGSAHEDMRHFRDLIDNEAAHRARLGNALYDAFLKMSRWSTQQAVLAQASVTPASLAMLFDVPKTGIATPFPAMWNDMIQNSSLRMHVGELPTKSGEAALFKQRVEASVADFKRRWDWLISPLVVPVALQVVVRPSPDTPKGVLHDLDNIVRDYLLPRIIPTFGTVSDHRWLIDFEEMRRRDPQAAAWLGENPAPPKGTRSGVTRYEAWRLPPAKEGQGGFVSAAIVLDNAVTEDVFGQIDRHIDKWAESLASDRSNW